MKEVNNSLASTQVIPTFSVTTDTTLVYGQQFYLDVTLTGSASFPSNIPLSVTATQNSGITIVPIGDVPVTIATEKTITGHYFVTIDDANAGTVNNDKVSFTVKLGAANISGNPFSYSVKKILTETLKPVPNNRVCVIPKKYSVPTVNDPEGSYISYTMKLLEDTGTPGSKIPLKKTMVYLISSPVEDLDSMLTFTSDPIQGSINPTIYKPTKFGYNNVIKLVSDDNAGEIKFRVYSNSSAPNYKPTMLTLAGLISTDNKPQEGNSVFFITPRVRTTPDALAPLYIPDADDNGVIYGNQDSSTFNVIIQNNYEYHPDDHVLFFTKETNEIPDVNSLITPILKVNNQGINTYTFPIPYSYFAINVPSDIFYVIANRDYSYYSIPEGIEYSGGGSELSPPGTISRIYNKVEIYSSYANYTSDSTLSNPDESKNLLYEESYTTKSDLSNYLYNNGFDVFLKIIATKDSNDKTRPIAGSKVYINMYVRAANKNYVQPIGPVTLPSVPDQFPTGNKTLCTKVIPIEHPQYSDIQAFENSPAYVYFEYYTIDENQNKIYSQYWSGMTNTSV
jgi:hypothetical protein